MKTRITAFIPDRVSSSEQKLNDIYVEADRLLAQNALNKCVGQLASCRTD
jgi:hypothetical protein